jgi:predicted Zn-dependent protease
VGERLVATSAAQETPYKFEFSLLADNEVINAFALPGGYFSQMGLPLLYRRSSR